MRQLGIDRDAARRATIRSVPTRRATRSRAEERRRLHGRHPRPAQGGRVLQRRHRLRHLRSDQQPLRVGHPRQRPGRDCRRDAGQRQLLRRRSARPVRARRSHRDRRRFPATPRSASACSRCSASCASRRTACARIADETGGFAAVNSNDFSTSFGRIVRDNSSYYVLGYYSTNTKRDGQFRGAERPGQEPVAAGPRAQGLRRAARAGRRRARRRRPASPRRLRCARRSTARCPSPVSASRRLPRRWPGRRRRTQSVGADGGRDRWRAR